MTSIAKTVLDEENDGRVVEGIQREQAVRPRVIVYADLLRDEGCAYQRMVAQWVSRRHTCPTML